MQCRGRSKGPHRHHNTHAGALAQLHRLNLHLPHGSLQGVCHHACHCVLQPSRLPHAPRLHGEGQDVGDVTRGAIQEEAWRTRGRGRRSGGVSG